MAASKKKTTEQTREKLSLPKEAFKAVAQPKKWYHQVGRTALDIAAGYGAAKGGKFLYDKIKNRK